MTYVREPKPGEAWRCEDWQCPSRFHCRHHFVRALEYWQMAERHDFALLTPDRFRPYAATCQHYELDRPRDYLDLCHSSERPCPGCSIPECRNRLDTVVPILAPRRRPH